MAVTVYGVSPSMGETEWAIYHRIATRGGWNEVVDTATDYAVTVASGTRQLNISAGDMAVNGTLVRSNSTAQVTLAVNGTGNSRIDTIVLQIDWSGTTSTAGTIVAVQGTAAASPVAPTLSRTAGTLWQVALANVTVAPSAGQLVAANVSQRTPQRRREIVTQTTINTVTVTAGGRQELALVSIPDPGWPFVVRLDAVVGFEHANAGYGIIVGQVNSSDLTSGRAGTLNDADATLVPKVSGNLTSAASARLQCERHTSMTGNLVSVPGRSGFTVTVVPN